MDGLMKRCSFTATTIGAVLDEGEALTGIYDPEDL
jgi:hypothetical protein